MIKKSKNDNKYINIISGKSTKYKYRFRTEEEFIKKFGPNWKHRLRFRWIDDNRMDFLFGANMETRHINFNGYKYTYYKNFLISTDMVTVNHSNVITSVYFKKKCLIYE